MKSATPQKRWLLRIAAIGMLIVLLFLVRIPLLKFAGKILERTDSLDPTKYVLVLAGGNETRPFVAAALVKAGYASEILLTKVKRSSAVEEGLVPPSHEVSRRVLLMRNVPAAKIQLLPPECATTYDEARALSQFLDEKSQTTVTVVTTDFHTRRTRWAFGHVLGSRISQVRFFAAPSIGFSSDNWWCSEEGLHTYVDEYGKLAFYFVYYKPVVSSVIVGIAIVAFSFSRGWLPTFRNKSAPKDKQVGVS